MSREAPPAPEDPAPERPRGTVEPTGPGPLVILGLVGLFAGWAVRGVTVRENMATPTVSWLAVAVTWFIAAAVSGTAYLTWRTVHRDRHRLSAQQGLARLVLGKTLARLGALGCGGFLGAAVSTLGVGGDNAPHALATAGLAAAGAGLALAAGLLLEHACRVPDEPRDDLR
jgi:hypothetical protein